MTTRKRSTIVWWATLTSMAVLNLILAGAVIRHFSVAEPYDPFGEFPLQITAAEVVAGQTVEVNVTKCYTDSTDVVGTISWRSLEPADAVFPVGTGVNSVDEGCHDFNYLNPWPPSALSQANAWLANGEIVVFRIEGIETPTIGGVSKLWRTTPFQVVPAQVGDDE